jgi:asparagine synthase (glutamine-hydrolysing)
MMLQDGSAWLTFNGEIYNFVELRTELEKLGRSFHTSSDTEVLLSAYAQWGEAMLERLVGMFSFVIYDVRRQRIFAARDRFGIKPLYYFASSRGVVFGSEIKQLVSQPGFSRRVNPARTFDYLSAGYTDHTEETMFADAQQLRGGQCVTLDLEALRHGAPLPVRRYYDIGRGPGPKLTEAQAARQFRDLFEDAIRLHLRADVRVGSCLSGGLDSSSIVMIMHQLLEGKGAEAIHTVSACFDDKAVDERPYMQTVVDASKAEPHYVFPSAERAFEIAEKTTWHQDEPYYNTSMYAQWCVFEEAARHGVKVMLDGQGADEQLAGYHYDNFELQTRTMLRRGNFAAAAQIVVQRKAWHGVSLRSQALSLPGRPRLPAWARKAPAPGRIGAGWLDTPLMNQVQSPIGAFGDALVRDRIGNADGTVDDIGELCIANTISATLPRLLRYEDRNSMAHSIEARLPFLDHRLVEFNVSLWNQHKIVGADTKRVLRAAMRDVLPANVMKRRDKIGFSTPQQDWFRGPLRKEMERRINDTIDFFPQLINADETRALLAASLDGSRPVGSDLWMLANLGVWGNLFDLKV